MRLLAYADTAFRFGCRPLPGSVAVQLLPFPLACIVTAELFVYLVTVDVDRDECGCGAF